MEAQHVRLSRVCKGPVPWLKGESTGGHMALRGRWFQGTQHHRHGNCERQAVSWAVSQRAAGRSVAGAGKATRTKGRNRNDHQEKSSLAGEQQVAEKALDSSEGQA